MGVDCSLLTEKGKYILDRWYCFPEFKPNKIYSKPEFLILINECILEYVEEYTDLENNSMILIKGNHSTPKIVDMCRDGLLYRLEYCSYAKALVGEKNLFIKDDDNNNKYHKMKKLF